MKETEWFYDHHKKEWWMVSITTNAKYIPKISLGDKTPSKPLPIQAVRGVSSLHGENKRLHTLILAMAGCLGISVATIVVLVSGLLK
jgi:hypothetical protein